MKDGLNKNTNTDYIFYVREHTEEEIEEGKYWSKVDWEAEHGEDTPMEEGFDHVPKYRAELNVELYEEPWGEGETVEEVVENLIDNLIDHSSYLETRLKVRDEDREHFNKWIAKLKDRKYWEGMKTIFKTEEEIEEERNQAILWLELYPINFNGKKWYRKDCDELFIQFYEEAQCLDGYDGVYLTDGLHIRPDGSTVDDGSKG